MIVVPENVSSFRDRNGRTRWRYRKSGKDVYLAGQPGDEVFRLAYEQALAGTGERARTRRSMVAGSYILPAIKRAQTRAKAQRVPFQIDVAGMKDLLDAQEWKCALSGIAFPMEQVTDRTRQAFRPSIDRIIPAEGYVPGNVRIVCEIVNLAMNNWGVGPLYELARMMRRKKVST